MVRVFTFWLRILGREVLAALGVLSLLSLSFAHQPVGAGAGTALVANGAPVQIICGSSLDPAGNGAGGNPPPARTCRACQISAGAALPGVPLAVAFRFPDVVSRFSGLEREGPRESLFRRTHGPRAPPAVV